LPAVQAAREAARRAQCVNHLKQLALGCLNCESAVKTFPASGWIGICMGHPDAGVGATQPGGWLFNIFPYIEEGTLYKAQQGLTGSTLQSAAKTVAMTPLDSMYCPSRRPVQTYPQRTDIVGYGNAVGATIAALMGCSNPGQAVVVYDASATTMAASTASGLTSVARSDYAGNGFSYSAYPYNDPGPAQNFFLEIANGTYVAGQYMAIPANLEGLRAQLTVMPGGQGGIFYYGLATPIAQVSDGTSNTYLCGEKYIDSNNYMNGLDGTIGGQYSGFDGDCICDYCGYDSDMVRFVAGNGPSVFVPSTSGYTPHQDWPGFSDAGVFGSAHAGMCNMAFCDGSVHQISYGISPAIHWQLGNRADGAAIDASMY
jgi:prepilin-type processing-associated H-X9-DG protein